MASFSRLVRFIPKDSKDKAVRIGEPVDAKQDVGLSVLQAKPVQVKVWSGQSVLSPGQATGEVSEIGKLLSPVSASEVGTIRCIGLNYMNHAHEVNMPVPTLPTLFMKPSTALADPYPSAATVIPNAFVADDAADYESEVAVVIGETCKNVSEADAMNYVLGYTAANDVSSRKAQLGQSQWCFSKSFDGACPIGPTIVHKSQVSDLSDMEITGSLNGKIVQQSKLDDLIFSIPKIISFLSQGTTLPAGTVILTGTPAGVGWSSNPRRTLHSGDDFRICVSHGVGTLVNKFEEEK